MSMRPYRRAVAVTGTYTDRSGVEKKRYVNVGTLFQYDDGGFALKLDSVPVGEGWSGFISFYEIEDRREDKREDKREGQQSGGGGGGGGDYGRATGRDSDARKQTRTDYAADLDDEIPF